jgi:hypothetical protein
MVTFQDFLSQIMSMNNQGQSTAPTAAIDPGTLQSLQQEYLTRVQEVMAGKAETPAEINDFPPPFGKRILGQIPQRCMR